jgi:hypothetical protein
MSETTAPYVEGAPGQLITAELWRVLQEKVYDDIRATSQAAADDVTHVATADDAYHLEGQDLNGLTEEITKRVLDDVRGRTGYLQVFRIIKEDETSVIEHGLGTAPLVDVYKLEYFPVVCREDDDTYLAFATFYLHHASERRVRVKVPKPGSSSGDTETISVDIQPKDGPDLGIPFADMLTRYGVAYTDTSSLDDLETEFWQAFFRDPNDQFGDDQFCHSPWFERCCKQKTSVRQLKDNGEWDDMIFQMRPWKTVNFPGTSQGDNELQLPPAPANVAVGHLDNNRTSLWLVGPALHGGRFENQIREYIGSAFDSETKVMVLLKV